MLVPNFVENRVSSLPDDFYDCLPQYCEDCNYPMEMTEALTQLHCSNPRCPSKVVQRLCAMANALGVKDLGEARATKFIKSWGITNPLFIFGYEPDIDGQMADDISLDMSNKIAKQFADRSSFTLAEYVRIANLPFIQTSAFELFMGYDDLEEAYRVIESGGVEYIRDRLNIKEKGTEDVSIRALKVYESLMTFKDDLIECLPFVSIVPIHTPDMVTLMAVCTSDVGEGFRTKADFYATCNNMYENVHIEFGASVTSKTDYVIWAGASGARAKVTAKVNKARKFIEAGSNMKIVTALEFISIIEGIAKGE